MYKIIINALGIQDSGGITVLAKLLDELKNQNKFKFLVICNGNENIMKLVNIYLDNKIFEFFIVENRKFLYRLYYENIVFRKLIETYNIDFIYNFSGLSQFFSKVPQITKVHNLLFYSKNIDGLYSQKRQYLKWFKQIFLKRVVFHTMLSQARYIEVQSSHVKEYMAYFIDISNKIFFIKSDICFSSTQFDKPKEYDFSQKIKFLYIVGPHFEYLHKNFEDFVKAMVELKKNKFDFEIAVTLTKVQLHDSVLWDKSLDEQTIFLGYVSEDDIRKQFQNNTILISTSVIETLGLHVIEAIQNGILTIVPNEVYSKSVYGDDVSTYELFDVNSMIDKINEIRLLDNKEIKNKILKNHQYLIKNENTKYHSILDVLNKILKEENV